MPEENGLHSQIIIILHLQSTYFTGQFNVYITFNLLKVEWMNELINEWAPNSINIVLIVMTSPCLEVTF